MLPEERAREKIDKQLINAGWDIVSRNEYVPKSTSAVKEALMQGNTESDYLLFVDDKAIAVVEAKREENPLGEEVQKQAEDYARTPQNWYGLWYQGLIPLKRQEDIFQEPADRSGRRLCGAFRDAFSEEDAVSHQSDVRVRCASEAG